MNFLLLVMLCLIPITTQAKKPLYEIGFASGTGGVPDYPASDQSKNRSIALPTFLYRGEIFRQDRKGSRARLFKNDSIDIDLSFGAAFNANSNNNDAREGMEDLDWLIEIGPRVNYTIYKTDNSFVEFELPFRFVTSTNGQFTRERGQHITPQIDYRNKFHPYFSYSFSFKLNYGSEVLNDYFYQVEKKDVTAERESYNAKAGYVSNSTSGNLIFSKDDLFIIVGATYATYNNSSNQNSPLFKSENSTSLYIAFNYFFFKSKELVD